MTHTATYPQHHDKLELDDHADASERRYMPGDVEWSVNYVMTEEGPVVTGKEVSGIYVWIGDTAWPVQRFRSEKVNGQFITLDAYAQAQRLYERTLDGEALVAKCCEHWIAEGEQESLEQWGDAA